MKLIPLGSGKFAKVDSKDYEDFIIHKWYANKVYKTFYAVRSKPRNDKIRKKLYMHREILGLEEGDNAIVDHINGDGLDNRQCNLRIVTHQENLKNNRRYRAKLK